ncbi:MAG: hypothetical protein V4485_00845 [Pseudomonadota bacterium]
MLSKIRKILTKNLAQYQNFSLNKGHVLVFLGQTGTYVGVYKNQHCIDSLYIKGEEYNIKEYSEFFSKYKKCHVSLILDTADVAMQKADIPTTQGILKDDPVSKFTRQNFGLDALVSYNVYDITMDGTETWHTLFASVNPSPFRTEIIEYLVSNFVYFNGVYFFNLNIPNLNSSLLHIAGMEDKSEFKIFATITEASGIRVVATHEKNILHSRRVEIPLDKTQNYIQGIVEQEITDCLIAGRQAIQDSKAKPTLILLASKEMQDLMQNGKFDAEEVIIVPTTSFKLNSDQELADKVILSALNKKLVLPASNNAFQVYFKLLKSNSFILKPISLILVLFIALVGANILKTKKLLWDTNRIANESYQASEEYRVIKEKYPNVKDLDQIIDFHAATIELKSAQILPFEALDKILDSLPSSFNISKIYWGLDADKHASRYSLFKNQDPSLNDQNNDNTKHKETGVRIEITAKYTTNALSEDIAITKLNEDMAILQKSMSLYDITYLHDKNNTFHRGTQVIIPVEFIITGPKQ